jgi:hypothetical protein
MSEAQIIADAINKLSDAIFWGLVFAAVIRGVMNQ